jgi:hypothetical protein
MSMSHEAAALCAPEADRTENDGNGILATSQHPAAALHAPRDHYLHQLNLLKHKILEECSRSKMFRLFIYGSDAGPDQKGMRTHLIPGALQHSATEGCIDDNCNLHQGQLVVKTLLEAIDVFLAKYKRNWRYFASVAKVCHVWRGEGRYIFKSWLQLHGAASAIKYAKQLPPKPISGRWFTVSRCEQRAFAAPSEVLCPVLLAICGVDNSDGPAAALLDVPEAGAVASSEAVEAVEDNPGPSPMAMAANATEIEPNPTSAALVAAASNLDEIRDEALH